MVAYWHIITPAYKHPVAKEKNTHETNPRRSTSSTRRQPLVRQPDPPNKLGTSLLSFVNIQPPPRPKEITQTKRVRVVSQV